MEGFTPFALPDIGEEEVSAVVKCLKSGWLTTGKMAQQFEKDFANFLGDKDLHCMSVNSASMGLRVLLDAYGVGEGDEVIVPTCTFSSTAMMPFHAGAKPVFVDIDEDTMNMDPVKLEQAITSKTKAIVPVHFAGLACDMQAINEIAKKHDLLVFEDAAHALPTISNGKTVGNNTSDGAIFSFYATKTITTGEGGMIVVNDAEKAKKCKILRLHGISKDVFDRYTSNKANWMYEIVEAGHKCNMTDMAASIGVEQLKKATSFAEKREYIAKKYLEAFKGLPIKLPAKPQGDNTHSWHLFVIRILENSGVSRNEFIDKMRELGVGCSVHFIPLHYHSFWQKELGVKKGDFPVSERAFECAVSLPIYTKMQDDDIDKVIAAVQKVLC